MFRKIFLIMNNIESALRSEHSPAEDTLQAVPQKTHIVNTLTDVKRDGDNRYYVSVKATPYQDSPDQNTYHVRVFVYAYRRDRAIQIGARIQGTTLPTALRGDIEEAAKKLVKENLDVIAARSANHEAVEKASNYEVAS